ncbi:hypothetical protein ACIBL3_45970 [Kribbella sp. NPDC050124]|uniref:hypothetical protein n=1 Tax=Kribbella sp. NPDC050124 TaxID=3364114 RepID=UPI00379B845C
MTHHVVVLVEGELSDLDVARLSTLYDDRTAHHLLVTTQVQRTQPGDWSILGVSSADTFGAPGVAGAASDSATEPADFLAHSIRKLREAGRTVTPDRTHRDLLAGGRALVERTGSDELIIVAWPDSYPRFALPEWQQRAATYLSVSRVQVVEHADWADRNHLIRTARSPVPR